jgi:hypothetical protein
MILMKLEFSRYIFENTQISNPMIVRPAIAELFYVDEQTHRQMDRLDEINGLFSQLFKRTQKPLSHLAFRPESPVKYKCDRSRLF